MQDTRGVKTMNESFEQTKVFEMNVTKQPSHKDGDGDGPMLKAASFFIAFVFIAVLLAFLMTPTIMMARWIFEGTNP